MGTVDGIGAEGPTRGTTPGDCGRGGFGGATAGGGNTTGGATARGGNATGGGAAAGGGNDTTGGASAGPGEIDAITLGAGSASAGAGI
jgi:hypothetical protein